MNPVLILTHNNLDLTKRCVESVYTQDIPTFCRFLDNGSTDGTLDWLSSDEDSGREYEDLYTNFDSNRGVSYGWNYGLKELFQKYSHVLCVNNDVVLPKWFYRRLLAKNEPFITGASVLHLPTVEPDDEPFGDGPDFSAFLIRRDIWNDVGPFDESMKNYASDCDWHVRAHKKGWQLYNSHLGFYHERSSTLNNATPFERAVIERQADADRAEFRRKWGVDVGSPQYGELFK